ncbi:MAG: GEVED domain-containing protein [Niabella sp.]
MNRKLTIMLWCIFCTVSTYAQITYSIPIGKVLDAGASGFKLPNGVKATGTLVSLGGGVHGNSGVWNTDPAAIGGQFNGINDGNATSTPSSGSGITIGSYGGSKNPKFFTRIQGDLFYIDEGTATNYSKAIGFWLHFASPIEVSQFLFLDIDGNNNSSNQEWLTSFCYNGNTKLNPSIALTGTTNLTKLTPSTLNSNWNNFIDANLSTAADNFNIGSNPELVMVNGSPPNADPDNTQHQALFNYTAGTLATDFFVFWGGINGVAATGLTQNSGVSPLIVKIKPDFGDAPNTYGTLEASNGASHGVVTNLYMGTDVIADADGSPSVGANTAADDNGVATIPDINNPSSQGGVVSGYSINVETVNNSGTTAKLIGWIDWNNNGVFEAGEAVSTNITNGQTTATLTWTNQTLSNHSGSATRNFTYMRLRLSTDVSMTTATPTGGVIDGEVEDYQVLFDIPLPATFGAINANITGNILSINWETLSENNSDHFNIYASTDAKQFVKIGTVSSKSLQGTSTAVLNYQFSKNISGELAVSIGFLVICVLGFAKKRFNMWMISLLLLGFVIVAISACTKNNDAPELGNNRHIYIQIVQVDKDGTEHSSKTIRAIAD